MRRTVLSATALACTAVLGGTVPAFADGTTASPAASVAPSAAPSEAPSAVPSTAPTRAATPAPARDSGQVAEVPRGAADTGVTESSSGSDSGTENVLIGGGAAVTLAAGAVVFAVRRRRATGA
ncbi:sortase-dependent protein [Streptomyces sp. NPDC004237]|uniref:sortase-dependent protein n=1 Tax=Streptomyces sp. NPDC004237 TaxID=3154455 RepID=UPI0033BF525E